MNKTKTQDRQRYGEWRKGVTEEMWLRGEHTVPHTRGASQSEPRSECRFLGGTARGRREWRCPGRGAAFPRDLSLTQVGSPGAGGACDAARSGPSSRLRVEDSGAFFLSVMWLRAGSSLGDTRCVHRGQLSRAGGKGRGREGKHAAENRGLFAERKPPRSRPPTQHELTN